MREKAQQASEAFKTLFWHPTEHGGVQFLRYGVVAVIAFAVDFGLLYVFTDKLHMFYLLSTTSSFFISVIVNYVLSTWWVFASRVDRRRSTEMLMFIAICTVALGLNDLFMWLFTSVAGIYYLYSKLITVAIVFFWSFAARRIMFQSDWLQRVFLRKKAAINQE
jgi:putative flippase GtrA